MMQKIHLFLLFASMAFSLSAQQMRPGFVAIDRSGGQQSFLLDHYPRLTFRTAEGFVSFTVRDTRNNTGTGVKTCVFGEVPEDPCTPVKTTDGATICASELPYAWEGETFTQSGVRTKTLRTADGCDSTVTFTLTVNPVYETSDGATVNASDLPYEWEGETFFKAGSKTKTLQSITGCDSTVTFTLTVLTEQQMTTGFVAIDRNGGQQKFLLGNYPRLTFQTADGVTSFNVRDTRNNTKTGVKTCVFIEVPDDEPCTPVETTDGASIDESDLPYTWEGETFTEAGSKTKTLQAADGCDSTVTFTLRVLYHNITLQENEDAQYYDLFAEDYNGVTVKTATLNRQFTQGKWATLCLPFDLKKGQMMSLGLYGRVFEFRYAEMTDAVLVTHFAVAQSVEAGKGYIVNANAKLAQKTSFVFSNVTVNTDADNGDISWLQGYNDGSGRGNIYLAGTLRTGILRGSMFLGLKDNKLYYPNTTTGTAVRAYRGFFRNNLTGSEEEFDAPCVRIVVDGEPMGELEIAGGDAVKADNAVKVIENGILYILRNGIRYDAQGKRVE